MIHQRTFSTDSFNPNNKHNSTSTSTTTTTTNNNMLHLNKQININDTNFEEISIPSKKRYSTVSIKQQQYPQQSQFQTPKNYCPSPLQLTRSSSIRSNGSINTILQQQLQQQSPMMVLQLQLQQQQQLVPNTPPSQYIININRTPNNLTPSQRLSLRKSNINNSISQYKSDQTNIFKYKQNPSPPPPPPAVLSEQQQQRNSPIIDDADELIDDNVIFNVPFSQSILSLNQHEKFLFDNQSRNMSFVTDDSTRTSSIISHVSINDSVSSIGGATNNDSIEQEEEEEEEEEEMHNISTSTIKKGNDTIITNITNEQFRSISKDAQELTVLCNKDEFAQIYDESFQKRKMLSNFKKIQSILPNRGTNTNSGGGGGGNGGGTVDSKFYSFTRPTWLPPKSSYEKAKHQKESEDILYNALYQESQLQQKRINELDSTIKQRNLDIKTWERSLLNIKTFQELSFKDITELYWRGISNEIRSNVWWKINLLKKPGKFNESFCDFYFDKYLIIQSKLCHLDKISREGKGSNTTTNSSRDDDDDDDDDEQTLLHSKVFDVKLLQWAKLYNQIYKDLMINVYPDANYFQDHQVISKINKIVISVILYLCDQSEATTTTTNSDVDVFKFYFPGMINLASIYYYNFKNTYKSFVSMCQFYNLRLPSMMITYLNCPNVELQSILKSSLNSYMIYKFEKILKFKLNRISVHFKIHNINSFDYLPQLILSLGLNLFNFEISQRIIDLILFDPNYDEIIINLIINYMMKIQHKLFGNKQEILSALLGGGGRNSSNGTTTTTTTTNANSSPSSSGNGSSSTVNPKYITGLNTYRYVNVGYEIEFLNSLRELCK